MKDPHLEQWKSLKNRYSKSDDEHIKFRAECINNLIESAEVKEKELNHFK